MIDSSGAVLRQRLAAPDLTSQALDASALSCDPAVGQRTSRKRETTPGGLLGGQQQADHEFGDESDDQRLRQHREMQ